MSDQTGTTYRCPECSGLDHVHKPNCPQHNDGEREGDYVHVSDYLQQKARADELANLWHEAASRADALAEAVGTERVEQLVAEALDALEASGWVVPLHVRECLPGDIARALSTPEKGKG